MAFLRVQTGPRAGTVVPIETASVAIGRGEKVALRLADQGSSRQHAEIFRAGELHFIRDLGSRNGTFVNDRRIEEAVLRDGDSIRIGDTVVSFWTSGSAAQKRILKLEDSSAGSLSVRFRDTIIGQVADPTAGTRPASPGAPAAGHHAGTGAGTGLAAASGPRDGRRDRESSRELGRRVGAILAEESSVQAVFERTVRELGLALGADRVDILMTDPHDPEASPRPVASYDTQGEGEITASRTIVNEVMRRKEGLLTSDASTDQRFVQADSIIQRSVHSVICAPMVALGAAQGVIYASRAQRSEVFDEEDLKAAGQVALQLSALLGAWKLSRERERILEDGLSLLASALRLAEKEDRPRAERMAGCARAIAAALALPPEDVLRAWVAGLIHDLGRPAGGGGDATQAAEAQTAVTQAVAAQAAFLRDAASGIAGLETILEAVRCQFERHDGTGKPRGLSGDEIPILGRVLALAREVETLLSSGAASSGEAGASTAETSVVDFPARIRELAGTGYHPDVVRACLIAHRNGELDGRSGRNWRELMSEPPDPGR